MKRRNFLGGLAGIFAAGVAPAIVAEPMKLWVPKEPKMVDRGFTQPIVFLDELAVQPLMEPRGLIFPYLNVDEASSLYYRDGVFSASPEPYPFEDFKGDAIDKQRQDYIKKSLAEKRRILMKMDTSRMYWLYDIPLQPVQA